MITWSSLFWIDLVSDCFTNFSEDLEKLNRRESIKKKMVHWNKLSLTLFSWKIWEKWSFTDSNMRRKLIQRKHNYQGYRNNHLKARQSWNRITLNLKEVQTFVKAKSIANKMAYNSEKSSRARASRGSKSTWVISKTPVATERPGLPLDKSSILTLNHPNRGGSQSTSSILGVLQLLNTKEGFQQIWVILFKKNSLTIVKEGLKKI